MVDNSHMKYVHLGNGINATVDDSDYELVSKHVWHIQISRSCQYAATARTTLMHRLIISPPKGLLVDHIDGNGLNNSRANLRLCTHADNMKNSRKPVPNGKMPSSRFKGVSLRTKFKGLTLIAPRQIWRSEIRCNNKKKYLGSYFTEEEAAKAYDAAAKQLHGEFARINFN